MEEQEQFGCVLTLSDRRKALCTSAWFSEGPFPGKNILVCGFINRVL